MLKKVWVMLVLCSVLMVSGCSGGMPKDNMDSVAVLGDVVSDLIMARQNRTFRLSEYELRKLSGDAKAAGMNESKYLRELIVHGGVDATHAEDRRNLIRQISGIATNINQMAKHCNESKWFGNVDVLKMTRALEEVIRLMKQLVERWR